MIKILVANRGRADLYETAAWGGRLTCVRSFTNPEAHLHESELVSDRPGRTFNRSAGVHQAYGQRHLIRDRATEKFARRVARAMGPEMQKDVTAHLVLVGAPRLLGRLRDMLPDSVQGMVRGVIPKDLARQTPTQISQYVREARRNGEFA